MNAPIRPRDRDAVIQSLRAGVVPRSGQHLIQVGRAREIETLVAPAATQSAPLMATQTAPPWPR